MTPRGDVPALLSGWRRAAEEAGALVVSAHVTFEFAGSSTLSYRFLASLRFGRPAGPEARRIKAFTVPGYRLTMHTVRPTMSGREIEVEDWGEEDGRADCRGQEG